MAISILPPVPLQSTEQSDISTLSNLIVTLAGVLNNEDRIPSADRTMSTDTIDSINNTIIDASDRIDAIINPTALP